MIATKKIQVKVHQTSNHQHPEGISSPRTWLSVASMQWILLLLLMLIGIVACQKPLPSRSFPRSKPVISGYEASDVLHISTSTSFLWDAKHTPLLSVTSPVSTYQMLQTQSSGDAHFQDQDGVHWYMTARRTGWGEVKMQIMRLAPVFQAAIEEPQPQPPTPINAMTMCMLALLLLVAILLVLVAILMLRVLRLTTVRPMWVYGQGYIIFSNNI